MNVLKIILKRDSTESTTFLSGLQNVEIKTLEETDCTDKTIGAYKLYEYSSNTLEMSGTIIFTRDACPDDERASVVRHFCRDGRPYASLPVSVLDENKSPDNFNSSFSDAKFLHEVLGIIIRATRTMKKRLKIYLAARNGSTLQKVNDLITRIVEGQDLDIEPIHVSTRGDEERLRQELLANWPCKVLCCVDKSARNIILHDTEPDEASQIVRPAEDTCGKDGVFVLLCGHRDIKGGDLYDKDHFNTTFLRHQPKLREMVTTSQFLSMNSNLSEGQEKAVLEWIQRPPDESMKQPASEDTVQCSGNLESIETAAPTENPGLFATWWAKFNRKRDVNEHS